jgi:hypothetical protein
MKWIKGDYDRLLATLYWWYRTYDRWPVVTYRKLFDGTEQFCGTVPQERNVKMTVTRSQFEAIVKILTTIYPGTKEAAFFSEFLSRKFDTFKKVGNNRREISITVPKHVVKGLLDLFIEFQKGKLDFSVVRTPIPVTPSNIKPGSFVEEPSTPEDEKVLDWVEKYYQETKEEDNKDELD